MKRIFIGFLISCFFFSWLLIPQPATKKVPIIPVEQENNQFSMPLVTDDPLTVAWNNGPPIEQRGEEFKKWLQCGVRIDVGGGYGSGTIVYYDSKTGYAYIQSCGHLWKGNMSASEGKRRNLTCEVNTWYHNNEKLNAYKTYRAEVLYYSNSRGYDVSLLRFKPDWKPTYIPIAKEGFKYTPGERFHSIGCDGAKEIAHYDVECIRTRQVGNSYDVVTKDNSPRPGRSGGGFISKENTLVGICWGTSSYSGIGGEGYFTPLEVIRSFNEKEGFGWLNDINQLARLIPIVDRNNPQQTYDKDYIPIPRDDL